MTVLIVLSILSAASLGILTTYTDIRYHKARNKHLLIFAVLGVMIQNANCILFPDTILLSLENIILTFAVSVAFYALKIWAAGDAKLFSVMVMLMPYCMYKESFHMSFPAFFTLGATFSVALLFVLVESVLLFVRDCKRHNKVSIAQLLPKPTKETLLSWLMAYLAVDTIDNVLRYQWSERFSENSYLLVLFNLLFANAVLSLIKTSRKKMIALACFLALRIILALFAGFTFSIPSLWNILIVLVILFLRQFTGRYNYRMIPTASATEGQVLSQSTVALFLMAQMEGLPIHTDENTRCRLSHEEAEAIRKWGTTKIGKGSVVIVRNIPFAPFIFAGNMIFTIASLYLRF